MLQPQRRKQQQLEKKLKLTWPHFRASALAMLSAAAAAAAATSPKRVCSRAASTAPAAPELQAKGRKERVDPILRPSSEQLPREEVEISSSLIKYLLIR